MESNLTLGKAVGLFAAMFVLALLPSLSSLVTSARAASSGLLHGILTSVGIVAGDIIFLLVALFGLSLLSQFTGQYFVYLRCLFGVYLLWLGVRMLRTQSSLQSTNLQQKSSLFSSFSVGFLLTLADQKAVIFYLGFLPAFLDLSKVSTLEAIATVAIIALAVGGAKLLYAVAGHRVGFLLQESRLSRIINIAAGFILIFSGLVTIFKAFS